MTPARRTPAITADNPAITSPRAPADRLYRAAAECVRQRQRYAALVAAGAIESEQEAALRVASLCDDILKSSVEEYQSHKIDALGKDEEWYRRGNSLWQASREYHRRHSTSNRSTKMGNAQGKMQLSEIAMDYDLEASALLGLQHAVAAYRKEVPDAHIETTSSPRVA